MISRLRARQIILDAAGVSRRAAFGRGIDAANKVIGHLGFIQIDTNYVVERTHHHVLWSRVPDYQTDWLQHLQEDQKIAEAWLYATGYIPVDAYRFSLSVKEALAKRGSEPSSSLTVLMRNIHNRIGREGPLRASDFENDRVGKSSGWWDWRPSKVALERLFLEGKLLATRGRDFQKVFDLPGNILPAGSDLTPPSDEEFARHMILAGLRMFGLASAKDIASRAKYVKGHRVKDEMVKMLDDGQIMETEVQGVKGIFYMLPQYVKKKIKTTGDVFIMSPFDPLIVFRQRLKEFFDFDYMVECFVPAPKRKYGYFSLPVLIGDRFVARMDAKAERKERKLIVRNLHFEKGGVSRAELKKFGEVLKKYAAFNGCADISIIKSNKKEWCKFILSVNNE